MVEYAIFHKPSKEYLFGNRSFTPDLRHSRRFISVEEAENHELPVNKMVDCVIVPIFNEMKKVDNGGH